jgi:hypothetical protein
MKQLLEKRIDELRELNGVSRKEPVIILLELNETIFLNYYGYEYKKERRLLQ